MAFDGVTISGIVSELKSALLGGHIDKIYQPESDEIILAIRSMGKTRKLLISANPSHPRFHLTELSKDNPMTPPLFCMVLRKHIIGKLIDIVQLGLERIIIFKIDSINEMGDFATKNLIVEIMGRHSNIILTDENDIILDCAKHITHDTSSVREVLPGKKYILPPSQDKHNALDLTKEDFFNILSSNPSSKAQAGIYQHYAGISPVMASEICYRASLDPSSFVSELSESNKSLLFDSFFTFISSVKSDNYSPRIIYDENGKIIDFSPIEMKQFISKNNELYSTFSTLLEHFYQKKDSVYRITQKTQDLKKLITQNIERCVKKKDIQNKTLKDISSRENLKLYGELITANIYSVKKGMTSLKVQNFYSELCEVIEIPLDSTLTPSENAQSYFKRYNKEKRTFIALQEQIIQNNEELDYLESVLSSLQSCADEQDIKQIRQELAEEGFIKKYYRGKKGAQSPKKAKPMHFISSDGFDIYVGKNNIQNDELTLRFAKPRDIWFHTKAIPGSHVIVVSDGNEIPDSTLNEAANLAAFYSKGQTSTLIPVDYTEKRNVKKPAGAKPGFVIYETNKTAYITPSEEELKKLEKLN